MSKTEFLKSLPIFTANYMYRSRFFNKVACWRPATLLKKDSGKGY